MLEHFQLAAATVVILAVSTFLLRRRDLDHIPTVGYTNPILSVLSGLKFVLGARGIIKKGYRQYPNGLFKIPMLNEWTVLLNGKQYIEDIRRASGDMLSGTLPTCEFFQFDYTLGPRVMANPFQHGVIRAAMTRNISARYEDIYQEVVRSYAEAIPCRGDEWVAVTAFPLQVEVISKVTARLFVGAPLCENEEFRSICEQTATELLKGSFLRYFPAIFRPLLARLFTRMHRLRSRMEDFLRADIEHRLEQERLHGSNWPDKPNDLITWLIEGARDANEEVTVPDMASRLLFTSFGAIHTTSIALVSALFQLCIQPEDAVRLREEVERVVSEGWSKDALKNMHELDSYIRESQRMNFMTLLSLGRKTLRDFTFSDGTVIPKNTSIAVNVFCRHHDENTYNNPYHFDGFRFVRENGVGQPLLATPTADFLSFGGGRPACPGRFLAVTELKTILAHILMTYDIKLENNSRVLPSKLYFETNVVPNRSANIMFRKKDVFRS